MSEDKTKKEPKRTQVYAYTETEDGKLVRLTAPEMFTQYDFESALKKKQIAIPEAIERDGIKTVNVMSVRITNTYSPKVETVEKIVF